MTSPAPTVAVTRRALAAVAAYALTASPLAAQQWTDWTAATLTSGTTPGSVSGVLTFGATNVNMLFTGDVRGAQVSGGTSDPWSFLPDLYTSPENGLINRPPGRDVISTSGGISTFGGPDRPFAQRVTFASAVVDPVMAIYALGPPDEDFRVQTLLFDTPFEVLNSRQVPRADGLVPSLVNLGQIGGQYALRGDAGFGLIRFTGTYTTISWTPGPNREPVAFGFTVGAVSVGPTAVVPEPATVALVGIGAAVLALAARRRAR